LADWDAAMITNDADRIGAFMADDWVIVGANGGLSDKESFLGHVRSGALVHDVMTTEAPLIRFHGDCATMIAWGASGGRYAGTPFRHRERSSNVFVWQNGRWRCALTHLSQHEDV
jgi:ketosteroid isomerase-like protein